MGHDASKVQMGTTTSSVKESSNHPGDAATFRAGLVLRLKSDNALSVAKADGAILGVSLGKDLSDAGRVSFARSGLGLPVLLTNGFTPTRGAQVHISDTTGKAVAAGAGATAVNALYASSTLTAVKEDGTTEPDGCALIDAPGGL